VYQAQKKEKILKVKKMEMLFHVGHVSERFSWIEL
jgi:nicotinamide mononucleotide (NMN) deamidase PncC